MGAPRALASEARSPLKERWAWGGCWKGRGCRKKTAPPDGCKAVTGNSSGRRVPAAASHSGRRSSCAAPHSRPLPPDNGPPRRPRRPLPPAASLNACLVSVAGQPGLATDRARARNPTRFSMMRLSPKPRHEETDASSHGTPAAKGRVTESDRRGVVVRACHRPLRASQQRARRIKMPRWHSKFRALHLYLDPPRLAAVEIDDGHVSLRCAPETPLLQPVAWTQRLPVR